MILSAAQDPKKPRTLGVSHVVGAGIAFVLMGCDPGPHGRDAAPTTSQRLAQVSVRLDYPGGSAPSVSVLAFRAEAIDTGSSDILGAVDPLVAPGPESACELRDVAGTARALRAQGGTVNLEELGGVSVQVSPAEELHPVPRVYPPLADVVSGVIAEAGPRDLGQVPDDFVLTVPTRTDQPMTVKLAVPAAPAVADSSDVPLDTRTSMSMKGDLVLRVSGPPRTFLEIRPFGAPSAIACAASSGGWVVVPHDLLVKLIASAGRAPVSFEAVWRDSRLLVASSESTRVSFEARSSAVLELRP
jgi:hypothetical protein